MLRQKAMLLRYNLVKLLIIAATFSRCLALLQAAAKVQ